MRLQKHVARLGAVAAVSSNDALYAQCVGSPISGDDTFYRQIEALALDFCPSEADATNVAMRLFHARPDGTDFYDVHTDAPSSIN